MRGSAIGVGGRATKKRGTYRRETTPTGRGPRAARPAARTPAATLSDGNSSAAVAVAAPVAVYRPAPATRIPRAPTTEKRPEERTRAALALLSRQINRGATSRHCAPSGPDDGAP